MSKSIEIMEAVESRLRGIAVSAGYLTDLGARLLVGWPQHLLAHQQASLPLMALHPGADGVSQWRGSKAQCVREAAVEVIIDPYDTAPVFLDQALHDIRSALVGLDIELAGVTSFDQGQAVWDEPGEGGALARITVPVSFTYIDDYGG